MTTAEIKKINTQNLKCDFGKHKDELYTRIPVNYLKWMVNISHPNSSIAQAELDRRGTVTPTLDISGHAIDRASLHCLSIWRDNSYEGEGLNAWLLRVAPLALKEGEEIKEEKFRYLGIDFVFELEGIWPVLKTVIRIK